MATLPNLTESDLIVLQELREKYPRQFYSNRTEFVIREMAKYINQFQVWRMSIMGETRSGKSEVAQAFCFKYVDIYNDRLKDKEFIKRLKSRLTNEIKVKNLKFNVEFIMASQSEYLYEIRQDASANKLTFGQIWLIDENREKDGLGSWSEKMELTNINNIIAKFCQSEIWITPRKLIEANAPYGLVTFKKDIKNKCNWALLYKIDMGVQGTEYKFLGWIQVPLHPHKKHRDQYEAKKSRWIMKEIQGGADERMVLRHEIAKQLSEDVLFAETKLNSKGNKAFVRNSKQQRSILEEWIIEKKCQSFNELEKEHIVSAAQDLAKRSWGVDQ